MNFLEQQFSTRKTPTLLQRRRVQKKCVPYPWPVVFASGTDAGKKLLLAWCKTNNIRDCDPESLKSNEKVCPVRFR